MPDRSRARGGTASTLAAAASGALVVAALLGLTLLPEPDAPEAVADDRRDESALAVTSACRGYELAMSGSGTRVLVGGLADEAAAADSAFGPFQAQEYFLDSYDPEVVEKTLDQGIAGVQAAAAQDGLPEEQYAAMAAVLDRLAQVRSLLLGRGPSGFDLDASLAALTSVRTGDGAVQELCG